MSLTFNGVNSDSLDVIVEKYPERVIPERIVETVRVPGRNGTLTRTQGFANVVQDYDVYVSAEAAGLPSASAAMAAWLLAPEGYQRLEDSYNSGEYRMGRLIQNADLQNFFNKYGRATLSFDCLPQRWLTSGETATTYTVNTTITNPTKFTALPLIEVVGTGDIVFSLGGFSVAIEDLVSSITLDCEAQNAYDGQDNLNSSITLSDGEFPQLAPGSNSLTITTGSVTSITITPRWWTI